MACLATSPMSAVGRTRRGEERLTKAHYHTLLPARRRSCYQHQKEAQCKHPELVWLRFKTQDHYSIQVRQRLVEPPEQDHPASHRSSSKARPRYPEAPELDLLTRWALPRPSSSGQCPEG